MALLKLFVYCLIIINYTSGEEENEYISEDLKVAAPFFDVTRLCLQRNIINARSRKIICLICKGFDPSCFGTASNTSTTEASTTITTTTELTTSTAKSTTAEAPAGE